jgi:4-amino-4-deoxy-L-arabinose transferase-like glycosyltransferase
MWLRTPGYPVFLAGLMVVVGTSPFWLGVGQSVVLLVLIPLVYWLGAVLVSRTVGLVAAGVCALDPLVSYHSAVLLTEGLTSVLLTALAIALVKAVRSAAGFPWWWLGVGLLLVASTMVRPTTYYLGAIIAVAATAWSGWRSRKLLTAAAAFAMVSIPQVMVIGSWRIRNSNLFGSSRFSSIEAVNMLFYRAAGVVARREGLSLDEAQVQLGEELGRPSDFVTQGEYIETMYSRGLEIVLAHPTDYVAVALRGLVWAVFGPGRESLALLFGDALGGPMAMGNLVVICLSWVLILVFLWSVKSSPSDRGAVLWVASVPLYLLVVSAGPETYGRFRTPVIPILLVFAVAGMAQAREVASMRSKRPR